MSYVVGHADVIKDPYVTAEFQRLEAYLKGLTPSLPAPSQERPDAPIIPPGGGAGGGGGGTVPKDTVGGGGTAAALGQRWLSGPWVLGYTGATVLNSGTPAWPQYPRVRPPTLAATQHNYAPAGIDGAVMLELQASADVDITGLRVTEHQDMRILGILNLNSGTVGAISLVNNSTSSQERNRFSWSSTVDERVTIQPGFAVWLLRDPVAQRWRLFSQPAIAPADLPPSLTPTVNMPPWYYWRATMVTDDVMTLVSTLDANAAYLGASGVTFASTLGFGATRQTGAAAGNNEGVQEPAGSGVFTLHNPTTDMLIRTGGDISSVRIWAMLLNGGTTFNSDTIGGGAHHGAGFRYSTVAGDGGWVGVTGDGTGSQTVSGTVAAIAASTVYRLRIRVEGSTIYFSVNGGTEVAMTTTLPNTQTILRWRIAVVTQAAAVRELTYFRTWQRGGYEPS